MKIASVITSAGLSSRMHEFKPLMTLGGDTVISKIINTLKDVGVDKIVVVVGYKADILATYLEKYGVSICINDNYATSDMYKSITLGLKQIDLSYDKILIMPGDVPLVRANTIKEMLSIDKKVDIIRPIYEDNLGHPIVVDKNAVDKIINYNGERGLRGAIEEADLSIYDYDVKDEGIVLDADTKEDFKLLRKKEIEMKGINGLWGDVDITVGFMDIVFDEVSSQFLEMIDNLQSIQAACSAMHMSYTKGWKMINNMEDALGKILLDRKSGGQNGGKTTLTDDGKKYVKAYQSYVQDVKTYAKCVFDKYFK